MRPGRGLLRCHPISITSITSITSSNQRLDGGQQLDVCVHSLVYAVNRGGRPCGDRNRISGDGGEEDFRREQAAALRRFLETRAEHSRHVIVSDDYLYQLDGETVSRVDDLLASAGPGDVRVIVYVREPASLYTLNPESAERLWLHCLAELCSQAAR